MLKRTCIALVILTLLLSGCATVTRGRAQDWTVRTQPDNAVATLSNGEVCRTPCTLKIKRKYPFTVDICKAGYKRVQVLIDSSIAGAGAAGVAGNAVAGGFLGAGVDAANGASKDLSPNPLDVTLEAEMPGCGAPKQPAVPPGGEDPRSTVDSFKSSPQP